MHVSRPVASLTAESAATALTGTSVPNSKSETAEMMFKSSAFSADIHDEDEDELQREAIRLDAVDSLSEMRKEFCIPDKTVYLCGHSLGLQPRRTRAAVESHLDKWASEGVDGHFSTPEPWASIEDDVSLLSMPLVGAKHPHEVVVMNSLTVNLHLLLMAHYRPTDARSVILIEEHAFSSDDYAVQTHVATRGVDPQSAIVRLRARDGETLLRDADIFDTIRKLDDDGRLSLVLLPGVQFYTGQVLPMQAVAALCMQRHIPFGLDLAHAVGNIPLHLHDWGVDFAVWCTYKYLNSGPGAVAGAFLHDKHAHAPLQRLAGWWGQARSSRFNMPQTFEPQHGIRGFQISNPPVLAIIPVTSSLRLLADAGGVVATRQKSITLTNFLLRTIRRRLAHHIEVITPTDSSRRGAQLSLRMAASVNISMSSVNDALAECGIICDVREPDVLRVAPAPLYNTFTDVWLFVCALEQVMRKLGIL